METESMDIVLPFEDEYVTADQARADRRIQRRRKAKSESTRFSLLSRESFVE